MQVWDVSLFRSINGWPEWMAPVLVFFSKGADTWPVRVLFLGIFVFLVWKRQTRAQGFIIGFGWIVANGITDLFKHYLPVARPGNILADVVVRIPMSNSMGTASAHSANMAFIAFAFGYFFGWKGSPWALVALLTGLSRIYVGAHFPSQVLLGWAVGCCSALAMCSAVNRWIIRPQTQESPTAAVEGDMEG
ncbi:MAG: phosphatase PAP2 family protein [Armatimonadetes bacterium]|nr:phosphatase PAP2 family protein [Armatimonadota bacterium]